MVLLALFTDWLPTDKPGEISPVSPAHMDWTSHFPEYVDPDSSNVNLSGARKLLRDVEVADVGCGFGGLLVGLAPLMPDTLMVGK